MKTTVLAGLEEIEERLRQLRKDIVESHSNRVSKVVLRDEATAIADLWVEKLRSPLEYRFKLPKETIEVYADDFKRLHVLSRPNNRKSSYLETIDSLLKKFKDRLILPVQQFSDAGDQVLNLLNLVQGLSDAAESDYLREALECAARGYRRGSRGVGGGATLHRIPPQIQSLGFDKVSQAAGGSERQPSGRLEPWEQGGYRAARHEAAG